MKFILTSLILLIAASSAQAEVVVNNNYKAFATKDLARQVEGGSLVCDSTKTLLTALEVIANAQKVDSAMQGRNQTITYKARGQDGVIGTVTAVLDARSPRIQSLTSKVEVYGRNMSGEFASKKIYGNCRE